MIKTNIAWDILSAKFPVNTVINKIVKTIKERIGAKIIGLRVSDLVPLMVQDVRGKTHLVMTEQKTKKTKRFLIPRATREMIEDYTRDMSPSAWLFPSSQKGNSHIFHHTGL